MKIGMSIIIFDQVNQSESPRIRFSAGAQTISNGRAIVLINRICCEIYY